jgi:hypothetical protein
MTKKIALDYDDSELRIVVANCNGSRVQVSDAKVISIGESESVSEKLRAYITGENLQKTDSLIVIGRGKAELRELQLPPASDDELPDMVRFQAIRSFASASERAIVDFLVTNRTAENTTLIAAAVAPIDLDRVKELCATSQLLPKRIALRPLSAASLYLRQCKPPQICVLIDLLADDAEIVIARDGKVIFVRTVRLPSEDQHRSGAIASELHRTMVACGETSTPDRIVVWGTEAVHTSDISAIKKTIGCEDVQAVNPFDLVDLQIDGGSLPEHVGRLAPLVGLLASDETAPETLIDFLNPRQRVEEEPDRVRRLLMIAAPLAALFLLSFFAYRQLADWDRKIANATSEVNTMLASSETADASIARTEIIDQFLDSDVNWLDEIRRLAVKAPPSEDLIVKSISGTANTKGGGGTLRVIGSVTDPGIIDAMEEALRDESHSVIGKGSQQQKGEDSYRWTFTESLTITGPELRNTRYARMAERESAAPDEAAPDGTKEDGTPEDAEPATAEPVEESSGQDEPSIETNQETEESTEVAA